MAELEMLTRLGKNAFAPARPAVVLLVLLALTLAGGNATALLFSRHERAGQGCGSIFDRAGLAQVVSSEDASEKMATTGSSCTGQAAWLLIPLHFQDNSSETRFKGRGSFDATLPYSRFLVGHNSALCVSPSRVSSILGRQQTLVGAKPSGTS